MNNTVNQGQVTTARVKQNSVCRRLHLGRLDHGRSTVASRACSSSTAWQERAKVCWLGEHAASHHKLTVQFRRQSGRTDTVVLLEQTKQVCQCTGRSVSVKGETETNVAKNFATGSVGCSDLISQRIKSKLVDGRRRRSRNSSVKVPMTLLTRPRKKYALHGGENDVDDAAEVGDLIFTMPEIPWDSFEDELARTNWETHVSDC